MMRARTIRAAVMGFALVAWAPIAHAGGGGAGSPVPGTLYDCYQIDGDNAPQTITVDDQFGERTGVKLGKAKLLCTPASGIVESGILQPGDFSEGDHLSCYEVPGKGSNPKVDKQVVDPFVAQTVRVGEGHYVCAQAFKCDVGVSCGPGAP
jgi:hypothetical protein